MIFNSFYGLNVCVSQNSHAEILIPNMMVLVGRAFRRGLIHEIGALVNGISALEKRLQKAP